MKIEFLEIKGNWREVANAARTTINMEPGSGEPSSEWKRKMLLCEHSPIRHISIHAKWVDLPSWVSVHLVRHKFGIEHWVRSQRSDRTGIDRSRLPQGALVEHEILVSAQAVINISRKRLCKQASPETRQAWMLFLSALKEIEPELASVCVPDCIYRGNCYEYKSCGYLKTNEFLKELKRYEDGF